MSSQNSEDLRIKKTTETQRDEPCIWGCPSLLEGDSGILGAGQTPMLADHTYIRERNDTADVAIS